MQTAVVGVRRVAPSSLGHTFVTKHKAAKACTEVGNLLIDQVQHLGDARGMPCVVLRQHQAPVHTADTTWLVAHRRGGLLVSTVLARIARLKRASLNHLSTIAAATSRAMALTWSVRMSVCARSYTLVMRGSVRGNHVKRASGTRHIATLLPRCTHVIRLSLSASLASTPTAPELQYNNPEASHKVTTLHHSVVRPHFTRTMCAVLV